MDVTYRIVAAICSKTGCDQAIHVSIGRFAGGVNDQGGLVIQCDKCQQKSFISVSNPNDASSVKNGGRVVATWDDDSVDRDTFLAAHGLTASNELSESMLVIPTTEPDEPLFELSERTIYRCLNCGDDLETAAYHKLGGALDAINSMLIAVEN